MVAHPKPIIAAVHGFAIGGGLTLAAACNLIVSTPDARWGLPEVRIGLFPTWGLQPVWQRIGLPRSRWLAWGIDSLDGQAARDIGLVDRVADDPLALAIALAHQLAALPAGASAAVKRDFAEDRSGEEADRYANALFSRACDTPDAAASFNRYGRLRE